MSKRAEGRQPRPAEAGNVICLTRERYRRGQNYFLLPHEDPVAFRQQREALDATYEPLGLLEEMAVERIHMAMHRVERYGHYLRSVEEAPVGAQGAKGMLTQQQKDRSVQQWAKLIRQGERSIESAIRHFRRTRRFNDARNRDHEPKPRGPRRPTPA